ncbi:2Fe-2S iron-sulfur cluster-binding protein [Arenibaculum pallidiluteum]|uniref:2Fe-2S iron-sulfur cluster-binding protein n=1 Tax=Arenibaculum pallidiluteum TaxID=2812559 RepID=UPI001A958ECB|nr:2Fe-2S iron-sulfur cluster-binding protein [Arenibaculum pallidiluteum]
MPTIIYEQPDGIRRRVDAPEGIDLMLAAKRNGVRGIEADCGGACACATCHVYVGDGFPLPEPEPEEQAMLAEVAAERLPQSRLACQITITSALDGLVLRIPARQF